MILKVCGITTLDDALLSIEAGANALGFNFYPPSPRYVTPEAAAAIVKALPADVLRVGVFVNESSERVLSTVRECGLDIAQLHGDESPADAPAGVRVWKAYRVGPDFDLSVLDAFPAEAFLLDAGSGALYGGSGHTFDWTRATGAHHKIIVAGGLGPDNVAEAIRVLKPWGIDACSRLESAPGRKDPQKVAAFLDAAQSVSV